MSRTVVKYVIYSINSVFALFGLVVMGLAVAVHLIIVLTAVLSIEAINGIEEKIKQVIYVSIAFGLIIFWISLSGCYGAYTEIKWLLKTYSVILGILTALLLAAGLVLFVNNYQDTVENNLMDRFTNNNVTFHGYEKIFKCCGLNSSNDYDYPNNVVPFTCCEGEMGDTPTCFKENAYPEGCKIKIGALVGSVTTATGITLMVIMTLQFALMGTVIYLIVIKKPKENADKFPYAPSTHNVTHVFPVRLGRSNSDPHLTTGVIRPNVQWNNIVLRF